MAKKKKARKPTRAEKRRPKSKLSRVIVYGRAFGPPGWRGTASVFKQFITPFMVERGLYTGSRKRPWGIGSDHNLLSLGSYAIDFPTFSGEDDARALVEAFGIEGWQPNSYTGYTVEIDGHRFRLQVLWGGGIDHDDHVHAGLRAL